MPEKPYSKTYEKNGQFEKNMGFFLKSVLL